MIEERSLIQKSKLQWLEAGDENIFFGYVCSMNCWFKFFSIFNVEWVFSNVLKKNVSNLLLVLHSLAWDQSFIIRFMDGEKLENF